MASSAGSKRERWYNNGFEEYRGEGHPPPQALLRLSELRPRGEITKVCCMAGACIMSSSVSAVQSLNHICSLATPWIATHQTSLSITSSQSLLKLMSIESVMPSNHLICRPLLFLPLIFPSIRVFSNESALHIRGPKHWSFSFNISFYSD